MQQTIPGGFLIAIDGIDGAGKTTLANALCAALAYGGTHVVCSKEPTQGRWGMLLRESAATGRLHPLDEVRYLLMDRREHVETLIRPTLDAGGCVILDRYYPSMVAYQGAAGLDTSTLLESNDFAPRADVLLVLDLEPAAGLARIRSRGDQPNAFETPATLEAARSIFLAMPAPHKRVLDATRSADDVLQEALFIVVTAVADKARRTLPPLQAMDAIGGLLPRLATG